MALYIQELIEKWLTRNEVEIPKVEVESSGLPSGAATEATVADIKTAVEILDNIVSGSEAQVDVVAALPAGSNTIGDVGIQPRSSGGCSIFRSLDLDESEEEIKASAGVVYGYNISNRSAIAAKYLKFYNAAAADVTVGTTVPVMTIYLRPAISYFFSIPQGIEFDTGITVAATTGIADNDTGAPAANDVVVNVFYK